MTNSKNKTDRFTSKGSDFEIVKPAPKKKAKAGAKTEATKQKKSK